jgi:hypothetical protein
MKIKVKKFFQNKDYILMELAKVIKKEIIEDKTDREVDKTDREVYKGIKEAEQEEEEEEEIEAVRIIEEEVIKKIGRLTMKMIKIKMPILIIIGVKMNKIPKIIKMKNQMINSVKKIIIITINIKNKANTKNMTS